MVLLNSGKRKKGDADDGEDSSNSRSRSRLVLHLGFGIIVHFKFVSFVAHRDRESFTRSKIRSELCVS